MGSGGTKEAQEPRRDVLHLIWSSRRSLCCQFGCKGSWTAARRVPELCRAPSQRGHFKLLCSVGWLRTEAPPCVWCIWRRGVVGSSHAGWTLRILEMSPLVCKSSSVCRRKSSSWSCADVSTYVTMCVVAHFIAQMSSCLGHPELFKTGLILFIFVSVSIWHLCALQHWIQSKMYSMKNYSMEMQDRFYSLGREAIQFKETGWD